MINTKGLYLGNFAPLHKGHQHCIETALDVVDELTILIYDEPEVTDIPLETRAGWLYQLYGSKDGVSIEKAYNAPTEIGYDDHLKALHEKYVIDTVGRDFDVFFSSEPYGEHMAQALNAEDYRIDEERETFPVSATQIRDSFTVDNTAPFREYVSDVVWRDLVTNVVVLGGTSTGKTTLTKALASEYDDERMPEYGDEFWHEHADENGELSTVQLAQLAREHRQREEEKLLDADQYLFTDTNAVTTGLFSRVYHGAIDPRLGEMMDACIPRYDVVFLCDDDIPFEPKPGRMGETERKTLQRMHKSWLDRNNVQYHLLSGSVEQRVEKAKRILE